MIKYSLQADEIETGQELWVSDGTAAGTHIFKDINTGIDSAFYPYYVSENPFVKFNDELYFRAEENQHGPEIWKTDGTVDGTVMLKDIFQGVGAAAAQPLNREWRKALFHSR